jgi:DNA-binding protein HU-beta
MTKNELIESISEHAGISLSEAGKAFSGLIESITKTLQAGDQITLPGFGTFSVSYRAARSGRNPRTGETIQIGAVRVAKFKPGKALKDAVNELEEEKK